VSKAREIKVASLGNGLRTFIDASARALDEIVVNGGRRGLQIVVRPADLILATSAVTVSLRC
jgi:Cys-tRNA(Pro)/Cys-tRNA(Cys) deacylase